MAEGRNRFATLAIRLIAAGMVSCAAPALALDKIRVGKSGPSSNSAPKPASGKS